MAGDHGGHVLHLRMYGDLADLAGGRRLTVSVTGQRGVTDAIESVGIPHTEIGHLLLDGHPVDLGAVAGPGQRIAVYPITPLTAAAPPPLRPPVPRPVRFVLDVHLGRLARRLRTLGLDADYDNDRDDPELAALTAATGRVLLTRDRGLLMRSEVVHGALVRSDVADDQALEVVRRFPLELAPFTRCVTCNGPLAEAPKHAVIDELPPRTKRDHDEFARCQRCGQVFWPGSHRDQLDPFVMRASSASALSRWRYGAAAGR